MFCARVKPTTRERKIADRRYFIVELREMPFTLNRHSLYMMDKTWSSESSHLFAPMGNRVQWNMPALTTDVIQLEVEFHQLPNPDPMPRQPS
jgi:hypothetical protein